jgi:hypothetical protein
MTDAEAYDLADKAGFQQMMHMRSGQVWLQPAAASNCSVELMRFAALVRNATLEEAASECDSIDGDPHPLADLAEVCADRLRSMKSKYA